MRVLQTDEVKFNRFCSDGLDWAWVAEGENGLVDKMVKGTIKFGGGSLMMWECMCWNGTGQACKIDGKMDKYLYVQILENELMGTLDEYGLNVNDIVFQQDNDPKYTSKLARNWLNDHGFDVMTWPAQSLDLNPIKHLLYYIKTKLREYKTLLLSIHKLQERVQKKWDSIPAEVCQNLIKSMPRRVAAVIKAKRGYTKY